MSRSRKPLALDSEDRKRPLNKLGLRCLARQDMGCFDIKEARLIFESDSHKWPKDSFFPKDGATGDFNLQVERDLYWLDTYKNLLTDM